MVGRAFVAEAVSPADTGGGIAFHSAQGTSDNGRVAWRSVSRLKQRWQPPGLIDLVHSHRQIDQPSTCLAMWSCPDRSLRSERRLYWFVGSVVVAASTSSNSARGPSALAESKIPVITGAWATVADGSTTGARCSRPGHDRCAAPSPGGCQSSPRDQRRRLAFRSSASWLLPQSQLTAGHHRSRRDGLTAEEAPHKKEFHSHAVGHPRRS
jgi:hypothetical protein